MDLAGPQAETEGELRLCRQHKYEEHVANNQHHPLLRNPLHNHRKRQMHLLAMVAASPS